MNPNLMRMDKIGAFLDIFVTSPNRRTALERAHVHAKAAGLWDTLSTEEKEEFTFFCYYLWMIAGDKRKKHLMRQNPMVLLPDGEDDRPDSNYHPGELKLGIEVELEHTDDVRIAKKIAKDHLDEIKNYYSLLVLMEKMHHDTTGQFFADYFDAMGNKLQVLAMMLGRVDVPENMKITFEKVLEIYKNFKSQLMTSRKVMSNSLKQNPVKRTLKKIRDDIKDDKTRLVKMCAKGEKPPKSYSKDYGKLKRFMRDDEKFAEQIRAADKRAGNNWASPKHKIDPEGKKKKLLDLCGRGAPRPSLSSKLGNALMRYAYDGDHAWSYDANFAKLIRYVNNKVGNDWFDDEEELNNEMRSNPWHIKLAKDLSKMGARLEKNLAEAEKSPMIQSVTIPASWDIKRAKAWLRAHGLKSSDIDEKPNTIRFRQHSPGLFKGYFSHKFANGVVLTLASLKRRRKGKYAYIPHKKLKKTAPRIFPILTLL